MSHHRSSTGRRAARSPCASRRRRLWHLVAIVLVLLASLGAAAADAQFLEPVDGEVVDGFRPPVHVGAPGNRGWEYRTEPGTPVLAASAGVVVFAGLIGGARYVSIQHESGLRTTYSLLASLAVAAGEAVARGTPVGTAATRFHFGVRRGDTYLDPALVLGGLVGEPVRLVPVEAGTIGGTPAQVTRAARAPSLEVAPAPVSGAPRYTRALAQRWVQ